jgi:hypothetical protein
MDASKKWSYLRSVLHLTRLPLHYLHFFHFTSLFRFTSTLLLSLPLSGLEVVFVCVLEKEREENYPTIFSKQSNNVTNLEAATFEYGRNKAMSLHLNLNWPLNISNWLSKIAKSRRTFLSICLLSCLVHYSNFIVVSAEYFLLIYYCCCLEFQEVSGSNLSL